MPIEASKGNANPTAKDQVKELYGDLKREVDHEAHRPLESTAGDLPLRKHVNGLTIAFFVFILVVLGIIGYVIYLHR